MKTFEFTLTETYSKTFIVRADNELEAYRLIREKYDNGDIVLTADDFQEYDLYSSEVSPNTINPYEANYLS